MQTKEHHIKSTVDEPKQLRQKEFWKNISMLKIEDYIWIENGYKPKVEAQVCYNNSNIFVRFISYENTIIARFTKINDPVHKDSCVEFFVNLYPNKTNAYFNFEVNPLGTMYVGFGALGDRNKLSAEDIQLIEIFATVKTPVIGEYDNWEVIYKIPLSLFAKYYGLKFNGDSARANFYKCGDETKFEHYGVWNNVSSNKPNFHLPEYFGDLVFTK